MAISKKTVFIIVGITGDLSQKMLMPALYTLQKKGLLADVAAIVGTSRSETNAETIVRKLSQTLGDDADDGRDLKQFAESLSLVTIDPGTREGAGTLLEYLDETYPGTRRMFYFSVPPSVFPHAIRSFGHAGLNTADDYLMIEKPFGHDLASSKDLAVIIDEFFEESHIYRVDHYVAKPGLDHVREWRKNLHDPKSVTHVKVASYESLDIQGRSDFYEQTGALRDLVQSHLLQVLAITLMDNHKPEDLDAFHDDKLEILRSLSVVSSGRGQYEGYRDEVGNDDSHVETFASLTLASSLKEWSHATFTLETGKALASKESVITVQQEGIVTSMDLNAKSESGLNAYERVFHDAAIGHHRLYLTADEVEQSWRIVDQTLDQWALNGQGLHEYPKGASADSVI